jgi:hypothetical protein
MEKIISNFPRLKPFYRDKWKIFHDICVIDGNFLPIHTDKRSAFGAPLIGQRDTRLSLIGSAPKAHRLSNSIEPTPFGLRSARSVGTENCIDMQFSVPTDGGSSRCPFGKETLSR